MATTIVQPPDIQQVLGPVLPSLPAAALSTEPPENVLPLLSPILRQRVKLLASSSSDPWIRLLCYDPANVPRLTEIAQGEGLQPHPVSGEVEVDWDYDAEIRYRRLDEETLQALVALKNLNLTFRLVYCIGDPMGGDGWRLGEVSVAEKPSPFSSFGGVSSVDEAERQFKESKSKPAQSNGLANGRSTMLMPDNDEDEDDDYWARYDATPARTPAIKRSPAPQSTQGGNATAEDDYYAQYDDVQPAMDNHDPDEEVNLDIAPPLGLAARSSTGVVNGGDEEETEINETRGTWTLANPPRSPSTHSRRSGDDPNLVHPHPRPASSTGSNASIEKLEAAAAKQEQSDFGVKQHVSRSIKSLFMLSRASGIDRDEFERLVKTELDMLGLMEE
ncbi:uncharacterized protein GGS25DRAFT_467871 [Hypoxylon fragiforme]|uniref:uncharacterized protein n=1 Tax=Hypoxylon fragiforme TaxID=63214 RepID=UPI0020C6EE08|nr:uncharacterized protein GGS25DRAFT_467871 [Hypoxylon fragiforme]KAI2613593.1 hypothetical protein GGS25DRAFT_467871 [Hypoxylon fragiforme]